MKKIFVIAACCGTVLVLAYAGAQQTSPPTEPSSSSVTIVYSDGTREEAVVCPETLKEVQGRNGRRFCIDPTNPPFQDLILLGGLPVAGIPYEEAHAITERHREELMELPGVENVVLGEDALLVWTSQPDIVPKQIEGLPIQTALTENSECPPGTVPVPELGRCKRTLPSPSNPSSFVPLPPPPGVVVLKPGKVREQADVCPENFKEVEGYGGWQMVFTSQQTTLL
ncbi:MAG: hypothetical protein AB7G75_28220 [Candidatus Binatia bacterium]